MAESLSLSPPEDATEAGTADAPTVVLDEGERSAAARPVAEGERGRRWWFLVALLVVVVVGLVVRLYVGSVVVGPMKLPLDTRTVIKQADLLLDGQGYADQGEGDPFPTAAHPPAHTFVIAAFKVVGLDDAPKLRAGFAFLASVGVALMGLLGRRLGGPVTGIVAAAIAALHPVWVQPPAIVMSEAELLVAVPAALLLGVRAIDRPSWGRAVAAGVACGCAALVRSEAVLLVPLLLGPVALVAVRGWKRRLAIFAVATLGFLAVVGPWLARNYIEFRGITMATSQGAVLTGANCDQTYAGPRMGGWVSDCAWDKPRLGVTGKQFRQLNEVQVSNLRQRTAISYALDHKGELPAVAWARLGRTWGFAENDDQYAYDVLEGRDPGWQQAGVVVNWILLALAVAGAALLPRRAWRRWVVVVAGPVIVCGAVLLFWGTTRMRVSAEPTLAVLAAYALVVVVGRLRHRDRTYAPEPFVPEVGGPGPATGPDREPGSEREPEPEPAPTPA